MKKILLIEDDLVFANVYRNTFVLEGFQVEVARDGQSGYDLVHSFQPDAVLLDLLLAKLPGVDLIRKMRAEPELRALPIIVFTNTFLTTTVQEAWKAGATKCLAKASCTPKEVLSTLLSALKAVDANTAPAPGTAPAPDKETPAAEPPSDDQFQEYLRQSFLNEFPQTITSLRNQLQVLIKLDETARTQHLLPIYRRVQSLAANAGIAGLSEIARLTEALAALLKELQEKPKSINASTLHTVASAVDCLAILFEQRASPTRDLFAARILVVDDEVISRRAITHALDKAKLKSVSVDDPLRALDLVSTGRFDLIFLDVDMPNMNGYELCSKIRVLPIYKKVPLVFVTGLNDFEARANSTMSGGNDFIAKPFLFIELAVKALIYLLRSPLPPAKK